MPHGKLYLTGAFTLAGTSVVTAYYLAGSLKIFTITAISLGIALLGLLPKYGAKALQTLTLLTTRDWLMLFLQSLFGIFLFRVFMLFGVRATTAAEAGILTGTTPAVTAVMAYFILKEKLSGSSALGIGCAVLGICLLQGGGLRSLFQFRHHLLGNALVLGAAASESTFNILSRRHKTRTHGHAAANIHPMVQTLLVCAIALCLSAVPALAERPFAAVSALGFRQWLALAWYGLVVTALAFAFFYAGAARCSAYTIAAFSGLIPLTAMLLSLLLLREHVAPLQWIGGVLILLSILLIGHKNRRTVC